MKQYKTKVDLIYDILIKDIESGRYKPGGATGDQPDFKE